jgi:hypothetical protein
MKGKEAGAASRGFSNNQNLQGGSNENSHRKYNRTR